MNVLLSPLVAPPSGTPSTVFVLEVTYAGAFPTAGVEAVVGARSLPMKLVRGTPQAGGWQVQTTLPTGSWPVTFLAVPDRGNSPSLAAGAIVVLASTPASPIAAPTRTAQPSSAAHGPQRASSSADAPAPLPMSAPADPASSEHQPPSGDARSVTPSGPPDQRSLSPGRGGTANGGPGAGPAAAPTGSHAASPVASPGRGAVATPPSGPGSTHGPRNRGLPEDGAPSEGRPPPADGAATTGEMLGDAVGILAVWGAMLAVAAGLIGTFIVRRRRRSSPLPATATATLADETAALLERRALRRARTVLPDDPIIASLGIDEVALARRSTERMRRRRPPAGPT